MDPFTAGRLLEVARSQVGVKESPPGSNRNKYGQAVGRDGEPWCAMFVTWCFRQIARPLPDVNGPDGLFTYCPSAVRWALRNGQTVAMPEPGDVVLYDWQHDGISDHVGIVESVLSPNLFRAIEGNTAVGQDSDGGEVMDRVRHVGDVTLFWRPPIEPLGKTTGSSEDEDVAIQFPIRATADGRWVKVRPVDGGRKLVSLLGPWADDLPAEAITEFLGTWTLDVAAALGKASLHGDVFVGPAPGGVVVSDSDGDYHFRVAP